MPDVVLDANLLVLLIVGSADRRYIARHRRLRAYTDSDFDLLQSLLPSMTSIIVTPNILTEASNLASQIAEPARSHIAEAFRFFVSLAQEHYVDARRAVMQPEFPQLWLTDAGVLEQMTKANLLLTADQELYLAALDRGLPAENFNYLRSL
jgi:hypothetical protein